MKVKMIKRPKIDGIAINYISIATKLSEMYDQSKRSEKKDTTTRVDAAEDDEAANLLQK